VIVTDKITYDDLPVSQLVEYAYTAHHAPFSAWHGGQKEAYVCVCVCACVLHRTRALLGQVPMRVAGPGRAQLTEP